LERRTNIFSIFFTKNISVFLFLAGVFNKKPCYLDKQQGVHEKTNKKFRQATGDKNLYKYNNNLLISSQNYLHKG